MRRLVLLRHGVTEWNRLRRLQGQADVPLDDEGRRQAEAAASALAALRPALLWSSDLRRARATAAAVGTATGLAVRTDERLREIHGGALQGLDHADAVARYGPAPWAYADHGGESDADVAARVVGAVEDAALELPEDSTGVLVSHGHAIRIALPGLLGWPADAAAMLAGLDNCGWVELVESPGAGSEGAAWRLAAYNRTPIS